MNLFLHSSQLCTKTIE